MSARDPVGDRRVDAQPVLVDLRLGAAAHCVRRAAATAAMSARSVEHDLDLVAADRALEPDGVSSVDHAAAVDHGDAVGELVGLVEVVRGQQHRRAAGRERADRLPDLAAPARVQAGRRLVEEEHLGREDHARGEVEAPAHAAAEPLRRRVGGVGQAELLEQLVGAALAPSRPSRWNSRPNITRFCRALRISSTAAFWPVRPIRRRTCAGLRLDVEAADARAAAVHPHERREDAARRSSCRRRSGRAARTRCRAAPRGRARRARASRRSACAASASVENRVLAQDIRGRLSSWAGASVY